MSHSDERRSAGGPRRLQTVLYAVTVAPSAYGLLRGQLAMLREQGYRVVVVCSPDPGLAEFAAIEDVDVFPIRMTRGLGSPQDLLAIISATRLILRLRPTLVNVATPKAALVVGLAARLARVPVRIYSLWGLRLEGERHGSLRYRLLWWAERVTCASATSVLSASASLRNRAVDLRVTNRDRIRVLGRGSTNGVDIDRFRPPSAEERHIGRARAGVECGDLVLGFVARLVADKGVEVLLDAFEQVALELSAVLLVVGGYDDADELPAAMRDRLEAHPRIHITGFQADPAPWFAAMDIVVLPSKREGLPNVLLEAAACGLPTITSDASGCPDAIEDGRTGVVVLQSDANRLAIEVLALGRDRTRRLAMGAAGRTLVERHYAQPVVWSSIRDHYAELIASNCPAD